MHVLTVEVNNYKCYLIRVWSQFYLETNEYKEVMCDIMVVDGTMKTTQSVAAILYRHHTNKIVAE